MSDEKRKPRNLQDEIDFEMSDMCEDELRELAGELTRQLSYATVNLARWASMAKAYRFDVSVLKERLGDCGGCDD